MKFRKILAFLMIPLLSSCSFNTIDEGEENVDEQTDWNETQKEIFENHLYGYVPSYEIFKGNSVSYDSPTNSILMSGVDCSPELLEDYSNSLVKDGFILESDEDNYYSLHKEIEVEDVTHYLCIDMGGMFDGATSFSEDGSGMFYFAMFDPYTYEWPTDDVKIAVDALTNESGTVLPAYPNVLDSIFIVEQYQSEGYVYVYVDTMDKNPCEIYKNTLENAGFSVINSSKIAYSQKGDLAVEYTVDETGYFVIGFRDCIRNWPAEKIALEIERFYPGATATFGKINANEYIVNPVSNFRSIAIYGMGATVTDLDNFVANLKANGWTTESYALEKYAFECVPNSEDFSLKAILKDGFVELQVTPYFKPSANWPAADIKKVTNELLATGTVPAYSGTCSSFAVQNELMYKGVVCNVGVNNEESSKEAYEKQLETLGYEVVAVDTTFGDKYYCYPGTELILSPQFLAAGSFTIDISRKDFGDEIPVEAMNKFLSVAGSSIQLQNFEITTPFTGIELVNWAFNDSIDGTFFQCFIYLDVSKNDSMMSEVVSLFRNNGFSQTGTETDYGTGVVLTKEKLTIVLYHGLVDGVSNEFLIEINVEAKRN